MSASTTFRYHTELLNGIEIEKPLPKRLHAIIQGRILGFLSEQLKGTAFEVLPELDMLCAGDRYVPDVLVAPTSAKYTDGQLDQGAYLVVEIMSPGQTIGRLFDKCEIYVNHGTPICWVIWPQRRQAWIYTKLAIVEVFESADDLLKACDPAPSLEVAVKNLFRDLPDTEE